MNPADVEGHIVPGPWRRVGTAALAGTVTVLPFAILEAVNRRGLPGETGVTRCFALAVRDRAAISGCAAGAGAESHAACGWVYEFAFPVLEVLGRRY